MKINLDAIVFEDGELVCNVILSNSGYLLYQECSEEYAIDYYVLDSDLNEIDGGQLCWGEYNEDTEMYDIEGDKQGYTYREFLEEINTLDDNIHFDENSIRIENDELTEFVWERIN